MDNTINAMNNINFNARYLQVNNSEKVPLKIYNAIYKSEGIDKFLAAGQPKTLWEHFKDLFKKNNILTVDYARDLAPVKRFQSGDPYSRLDEVSFTYGKEGTFFAKRRKFFISAEQEGTPQLKDGVSRYEAPDKTIEDKIAEEIEAISDLDKLLK